MSNIFSQLFLPEPSLFPATHLKGCVCFNQPLSPRNITCCKKGRGEMLNSSSAKWSRWRKNKVLLIDWLIDWPLNLSAHVGHFGKSLELTGWFVFTRKFGSCLCRVAAFTNNSNIHPQCHKQQQHGTQQHWDQRRLEEQICRQGD